MPKVSVILTSYNHGKYIREAIDSVLVQTFADFELIIWDDASSDDSWRIIGSYSDPRIKAFRNDETRRGIYGINKAIAEVAAGEYIAIHHSDDIWEPEKLAKQVEYLNSHPQIGAVFTNVSAIGEDSTPLNDSPHFYSGIFSQPNRTRQEWLNYFFYHSNALCHPSVLIRKKCYEDCGLYRYGLAQLGDLDMWMRLCQRYDIHVMPDKLVRFRVRANEANASGSRPEARVRSTTEFYYLLKNYLRIKTFEEMLAIFPEAKKYYQSNGFESKFVFSMVALDSSSRCAKLLGIEILFDLLNDSNKAREIKSLYKFDYRDLVSLTAMNDVFSLQEVATVRNLEAAIKAKDNQISQLETHGAGLEALIKDRENQVGQLESHVSDLVALLKARDSALESIYNSTGWKILRVFYRLRDKVFSASRLSPGQ